MKRFTAMLLVCVMALALAACGSTTTSTESSSTGSTSSVSSTSAAVNPVTLKFNLVKSTTDPQYEWYGRFWDEVNAKTNGEVTGEIYTSESLGKTADVIEQAAQGEAVVADCDVAYLANYVPDFAAIMSPYLIQEPEQMTALWKSDVFQDLCTQLEAKGLHLIALNYEGTRNLITTSPVTSRADVAKLKVRCASTTMWNTVVNVLNGNPTNIAMSETYQAMSQGVVDGAEGVFSVIYSQKWYECCKYITLTEHLNGYTAIVMSSEVYDSLSDDAKTGLGQSADNYMKEFMALSGGVQDEYRAKLEAEGVTISTIDKTEFIAAAANVSENFPDWSDGILEKLQAALNS